MSFNQNQYNQSIRPTNYAAVVTQPSDFTGNHFLLGSQVTVTAFGKQNNTSLNQCQVGLQLDEKPKIKVNQSNTAKKQGKPRQRGEQSQPNKRQTKIKPNKQQSSLIKNQLKVTWKNKNNLKNSEMLNGSRMNGNQKTHDQINCFGDNKSAMPQQGIINVVHLPAVNGREPSRLTETGQEEEHEHPGRPPPHQGNLASRQQSPKFFDIRNIVGNGESAKKRNNLHLNAPEVIEFIDDDDDDEHTVENNNLNPIVQVKAVSALCQTNIATPYVCRGNQSQDNESAGWDQNIQLQDVTIEVKRPKPSQVFEIHNQPSTSVATTSNRPIVSRSLFQVNGQTDQREQVDKDNVKDVINTVASFNSNYQNKAKTSSVIEATSTKINLSRRPSRPTPPMRREKYKAKAKQSIKIRKSKKQQSSLRNENIPHTSSQSHSNQDVIAGVVALLSCRLCRLWITSEELKTCDCGFVCITCLERSKVCAVCEKEPKEDAGVAKLHCRLTAVVPHRCRYYGCRHTVQPGEDHEAHCSFRPFHCYQCQHPVAMNRGVEHIRTAHPQQPPLGDKNENVKLENFYLIPSTEKRVAYCFVQDQLVMIMINKFDNQPMASFLIHALVNDDNTKITVKFEFTLKLYTHSRDVAFSGIGPAFVEVQMEVFNDWVKGLCTLDLIIGVKKIRKSINSHVGIQNKKLKLSN